MATMTIFLILKEDQITLRLPSPAGMKIKVDYIVDIREGETWSGYTYEELRALGDGGHTVKDRTRKEE